VKKRENVFVRQAHVELHSLTVSNQNYTQDVYFYPDDSEEEENKTNL
jgi:hypothetical protein